MLLGLVCVVSYLCFRMRLFESCHYFLAKPDSHHSRYHDETKDEGDGSTYRATQSGLALGDERGPDSKDPIRQRKWEACRQPLRICPCILKEMLFRMSGLLQTSSNRAYCIAPGPFGFIKPVAGSPIRK